MLTITNLHKRHGDLQVLRGVSLSVEKGRVAVLLGPSGSGKSTVLRCINGLETFDAGEISVDGMHVTSALSAHERAARLQQVRQRVGMVFQQFHLFPHLSVLENVIEAPTHVLKKPRDQAVIQAQALLDRVGLGNRLNSRPDQLSGGQQQRVAIARALAMRPDLMLFDEPTSALDPQMTAEVESVIADLAQGGQTMVVVTHAMQFAGRIADQVHLMQGGVIYFEGSAEEAFKRTDGGGTPK